MRLADDRIARFARQLLVPAFGEAAQGRLGEARVRADRDKHRFLDQLSSRGGPRPAGGAGPTSTSGVVCRYFRRYLRDSGLRGSDSVGSVSTSPPARSWSFCTIWW